MPSAVQNSNKALLAGLTPSDE